MSIEGTNQKNGASSLVIQINTPPPSQTTALLPVEHKTRDTAAVVFAIIAGLSIFGAITIGTVNYYHEMQKDAVYITVTSLCLLAFVTAAISLRLKNLSCEGRTYKPVLAK